MQKVVHKISLSVVSILLFISFLQIGSINIYCISEDGNIKVESICDPCCSEDVEKCVVDNISTCQLDHENTSNCSDVEIRFNFRINRNEFNANNQIEISNLLITKINIDESTAVKNSHSTIQKYINPPNFYQHLLFASTVVMNC